MRVAVIGSSGFIGSYLVEELNKEHAVDGYDITESTWTGYHLDLKWNKENILDTLNTSRYDAIINVAGLLGTHELFDDVENAVEVNVLGQYAVAWAAAQLEIPYVTIEQPHVWTNPYETTRGAGVRLARALAQHNGLRLATVEAFNAYGPRQAHGEGHPQKIVPTFSKAALNDEPIVIYGDGTQMVNLVHARDIAKLMIAAIPEASTEQPHFIGASVRGNFSVNDVAHMVLDHTGGGQIEYTPMRPGETDNGEGAMAVESRLHLQPHVPEFDRYQFNKTIDWYKAH